MPVIDVPPPEFMEDEEISIFADAVGKFYAKHAPEKRILKWREDGQVERGFWNEAGEAGLLGVSVPEEYGGHGGDFRHDMVVIDQQAKHGVEGFAASLHNTVILPYLVRHGTEEQKKKYLPKLVTGELVSAIAMTEPGVGSDLQSITTTALKDGNGYRINGAKTYISNGQTADFHHCRRQNRSERARQGHFPDAARNGRRRGFPARQEARQDRNGRRRYVRAVLR